jgi:hypothetical protein
LDDHPTNSRRRTETDRTFFEFAQRLKNPPPHEAIELRKLLYGKTPDDQKGAGQVREE